MNNKDDKINNNSLNDFDFEEDFGGIDGFGESQSEPPPTNAREAVTQSLKNGAKGLVEEVTGDKLKTIADVAKSSVPRALSQESSDLISIADTVKEEYYNASKEIRSTAKTTLKAMERILPKNEKVQKIVGRIGSFLGTDIEEKAAASKAEQEKLAITNSITEALGEKNDRDKMENLIREQVAINRQKTTNELISNIGADIERIRKFNLEIADSYFRKSLELQYASLYTAREQLGVIKTGMDTFKNQFESIIHNTGLPDVIKLRKTEAFKAILMQKTMNDVQDSLFKDGSMLGNAKKNIKDIASNIKEQIIGGLSATGDIANMKAEMDEMGGGLNKSNMAGGMIGDKIKSYLGEKAGDALSKTKYGKEAIFNIKNAAVDVSATAKDKASQLLSDVDEEGNVPLLKRMAAGILNFAGNVTHLNNKDINQIKIEKDDLNGASVFDGRAYSSLVKVIPGLLSKIYGEIKSIRNNDSKPENNEINYDFNKEKFINSKENIESLKSSFQSKISTNSAYYIDNFIDLLKSKGGLKIKNDSEMKEYRKGIVKFLLSDKPLIPDKLKKNGFLDNFPSKYHKVLDRVLTKVLGNAKEDPRILDEFTNSLKMVKQSIPNINDKIKELKDSGQMGSLVDSGLVKYDEIADRHTFNNENFESMLLELTGNIDSDKIKYLKDEKQEAINKLKEAKDKEEGKAGFFSGYKKYTKSTKTAAELLREGTRSASELDIPGMGKKYRNKVRDSINKTKAKIKLNDEQESLLRTKFFSSKEYLEGHVKTLAEYKEALGIKIDTYVDSIDSTDTSISKVDKIRNKIMDSLKDTKNSIIKLSSEQEAILRTKFLSSKEYLEGHVPTLKAYKEALGVDVYKVINDATGYTKSTSAKVKTKAHNTYNTARDEFNKAKAKIKLTEEQEASLRTKFFSSKEYLEGHIKTLTAYKEALGIETEKYIESSGISDTVKNNINTAKDKVNEVKNNFTAEPKEITLEEETALREVFYDSQEFKKGHVSNFVDWLYGLGYTNTKKKTLFDKARSLDLKLFGAIKSVIGSGAKGLFSVGKVGAKITGKAIPTVNVMKKTKEVLKVTRSLDRKAMGLLGKGISKIPGLAFKAGKLGANAGYQLGKFGLKTGGVVAGSVLKQVTGYDLIDRLVSRKVDEYRAAEDKKKKKIDPFDRDGDGKRDGNWKDRLNIFNRKKSDNTASNKTFMETVKDNKGLSISAILLGIFAASKAMGVTLEDVKNFGSGMVDGFKKVGSILGGVYDVVKAVVSKIASIGSSIGNAFGNTLKAILPEGLLTKMKSWFGGDESSASSGGVNADGTPIIDGDRAESATDAGEYAAYGIAGALAYKPAKMLYGAGKATLGLAKSAVGVSKATAGVAAKAANKVKPGVIKPFLSKISNLLVRKLGKAGAAKLTAKIATRLVPFAGAALLAYDAVKISYDVVANGTPLSTAISNQLLGFDIFSDDDPIVDEHGNLIEPKIDTLGKDETIKDANSNTTATSTIDNKTSPVINERLNDKVVTGKARSAVGGGIGKVIPPPSPRDKTVSSLLPANNNDYKTSTPVSDAKDIKGNYGFDKDALISDLIRDEGNILHTYKDSEGYDTIGVGHLVDPKKGIPLEKIIGVNKNVITKQEAKEILTYDINRTTKDFYSKIPWLEDKPEPVQRNLTNMAFNLGTGGLLGFNNTLNKVKNDEYYDAALNMQESKWYGQVGNRAKRIISEIAYAPTNNVGFNRSDSIDSMDTITDTGGAVKPYSGNVPNDTSLINDDATRVISAPTNELSVINKQKEIQLAEGKNSSLIKPMNDVSKINTEGNDILLSVDDTLKKSMEIQLQMLDALKNMNKQSLVAAGSNEQIANNTNGIPKHKESMPEPAINLKRASF